MRKKILTAICSVLIIFIYMSVPAGATQSFTENYSKLYIMTGNKATDIVNIALAQTGKKKADFGYSEAWCADFVCDCAILAGAADAIPANGRVSSLYKAVLAAGGTEVKTPQKGDLVFYYCKVDGYVHVGLMTDAQKSVEGNYSGRVSVVNGIYKDTHGHSLADGSVTRKFVRPAYNAENVTPEPINTDPVVIKEFTEDYAGDYEVITNSSPLTIRKDPSTNGARVSSIPKGMVIIVEKGNGDWAYTSYNGVSGYVSMDFLTRANKPAKGDSVIYGDATYKVTSVSGKKVKVKYEKCLATDSSGIAMTKKFTRGSYTCTVTSVSSKAFTECKKLTQIKIPKTEYSSLKKLLKKARLSSKVKLTKV